jgi:hypothetical protein
MTSRSASTGWIVALFIEMSKDFRLGRWQYLVEPVTADVVRELCLSREFWCYFVELSPEPGDLLGPDEIKWLVEFQLKDWIRGSPDHAMVCIGPCLDKVREVRSRRAEANKLRKACVPLARHQKKSTSTKRL